MRALHLALSGLALIGLLAGAACSKTTTSPQSQTSISETDPVAFRDCRKTVNEDSGAASEDCAIER